jgi:hypothetical protein
MRNSLNPKHAGYNLGATDSLPRPGDFPIGSEHSRAAARAMLQARKSSRRIIRFIHHVPRPDRSRQNVKRIPGLDRRRVPTAPRDHDKPYVMSRFEDIDGDLYEWVYQPAGVGL